MKYGLNDKPKLMPLLMYGLQWWVVAAPSIIVMGLVVARLHFGADTAAQVLYMQKLFLLTGITMGVQILSGHKLPVVTGPASVLLVGVLASLSSGIPAIYTAIFTGGIFITIVAASGLLAHIKSIFTVKVIAVIMLLIPFTLMPTIIKLVFQNELHPVFNISFALIFVFSLMILNKLLRGIWKSTTLIWGIIAGTLVIFAMHGFPHLNKVTTADASNLSLFIKPEFDAGVILSFLFCAVVLIINEVGSIQSVGHIIKADNMAKRNKRGVAITGISNMLAGLTGVIGAVDYTTSTGIISSTKCASRFPFIPTAVLLIVCSFFPQFISMLLLIPPIIMGTVLMYIMSMQLAAGLQLVVKENALANFDDGLTLGLPLMVAIIISFAPVEVIGQIPSLIRPVLGNGFVMGVITVLLMEHVVYRKKRTQAK